VQYAHARIASVIAKAAAEGLTSAGADTSLLTHEAEQTLLRKLLLLPEVLEKVVLELAPHHLTHYAQELAGAFHPFYTQCRVIQADQTDLTKARLRLLEATQTVLARTLSLMGISSPDQM
jgi:arginyl-tRNA synthetase